MVDVSRRPLVVHWLRNPGEWVLPVLLSISAVVIAGTAFAGWGPFGPPPPKDCGQAPDPASCQRENEQARLDQRGKDTDTAVRIGTGLFAFAAGYVALRSHLVKRAEHELAHDRALTERYTKAIDQLGTDDKPDVVLGGIYALERVALDSLDRDLPTIEQVLTAYIRRNAGQATAALTVINRLSRQESDRPPLDLFGADLTGVNLTRFNLSGVNLSGVNLTAADLSNADLSNADLRDANLFGVNLSGAHLSGASLTRANLTEANLTGAHCEFSYGAYMSANFSGANLTRANLTRANLGGVNLTNADLTGADLTNANLVSVPDEGLFRTKLSGAKLTGANFTGAGVTGVVLTAEQRAAAIGL